MLCPDLDPALAESIALGGDRQLSYNAIQQALPVNHPTLQRLFCFPLLSGLYVQ